MTEAEQQIIGPVRSAALAGFAASIGWIFTEDASHLPGQWSRAPFGDARGATAQTGTALACNHLAGRFRGRDAAAFDYVGLPGHFAEQHEGTDLPSLPGLALTVARELYSTKRVRSLVPHMFSVAMLSIPGRLPGVEVVHEHVGAKLEKAFGARDTNFESGRFNREWRIESEVPKLGHDVVNPRVMELLLAGPRWSFSIEGDKIWTWTFGFYPPAQAGTFLGERLEWLSSIVDLIPPFVWDEHPRVAPLSSLTTTTWFPEEPS